MSFYLFSCNKKVIKEPVINKVEKSPEIKPVASTKTDVIEEINIFPKWLQELYPKTDTNIEGLEFISRDYVSFKEVNDSICYYIYRA